MSVRHHKVNRDEFKDPNFRSRKAVSDAEADRLIRNTYIAGASKPSMNRSAVNRRGTPFGRGRGVTGVARIPAVDRWGVSMVG